MDEDPAVCMWAEFHPGPLSESGEGIALEGGAITVVAVLADEALESEVEKDAGVGSCAPSRGISCCGCVLPDDGWDEEEDEGGGDGSRAARSPVEERFGFACFTLLSCVDSSQGRRLGVWLCGPLKDPDALRGLVVGRGVWCDWASRSRDRLTDLLW
jgi:hypothetical protein